MADNTQGAPGAAANNLSITLPQDNQEVIQFFNKYQNDPLKIKEAYTNVRSMASRADEYLPAKEYAIPAGIELPDSTKNAILDTARGLEVSNKQFLKMVEKASSEYRSAAEKVKQQNDLRAVALGGKDGEEALKSFFADKIPQAALDKILKDSPIDLLQELKSFRDKSLGADSSLNSQIGDPNQANTDPAMQLQDLKSKYFKVRDDFEKKERQLGPNHPEVKMIGYQQLELKKVLENHMINMERHAQRGFK